jgi:hypothetical protein
MEPTFFPRLERRKTKGDRREFDFDQLTRASHDPAGHQVTRLFREHPFPAVLDLLESIHQHTVLSGCVLEDRLRINSCIPLHSSIVGVTSSGDSIKSNDPVPYTLHLRRRLF